VQSPTFNEKFAVVKYRIMILLVLFITFELKAQITFHEGEQVLNRVRSLYQEDTTTIFTFQTRFSGSDSLTIIFVLPVEEEKEVCIFGSGIREIRELADSNLISNDIVFIQPGFTRIPWYGDHPDNKQISQEKYLIDLISQVSLIFNNYHKRIYLLGFSKSGWGSLSVLLNFPDIIDGIFIWDTPFCTGFNKDWGMDQVFRDKRYFNSNYILTNRIGKSAIKLKDKIIVIGGNYMFLKETETFLKLMDEEKISYYYNLDLQYRHEWNKGWIYSLLQYKKDIVADTTDKH
jgi:hypothetical protein